MDRVQKAVVISLITTSAIAWFASIDSPDMMVAMTTYNPLSISLFTASWTAGMAAMMFPAITPLVLMYNRLVMNSTIMTTGNTVFIQYLYGSLLIIAGAYQFTPLKRICIGYCESPMSFFMRRWRDGASGAFKMGVYHGIYCLGCCWAYFLLMV